MIGFIFDATRQSASADSAVYENSQPFREIRSRTLLAISSEIAAPMEATGATY